MQPAEAAIQQREGVNLTQLSPTIVKGGCVTMRKAETSLKVSSITKLWTWTYLYSIFAHKLFQDLIYSERTDQNLDLGARGPSNERLFS